MSTSQTTAPVSEQTFSIKTRKAVPIDEEGLLTEEDKAKKSAAPKEDCTTRRRACKNCVCGRAELEAKAAREGVVLEDDPNPPAGGCGNCAKGDAFRCAGCPFLGKPAWNTAEDGKVKLNLTDDI
jgi:hypothetical protein